MEYIFNLYSLQITPRLLTISLYLLKDDTECKYPFFTCYEPVSQVSKYACTGNENTNRFEISSLLEKILLKQVRWCLTFVGLYIAKLLVCITVVLARRVADHFRVNHSIIVRLMQRFRQTGNVTDRQLY
jgi:hypothetical protein